MPQPAMTDAQYKKALHNHAQELWNAYDAALAIDGKFAASLKPLADAAYDLHAEFCRVSSRYESEVFHHKIELAKTYAR